MNDVMEYLLEGDPAIRWQTLRDLAGADPETVAAERARVVTEGWGARLLAEQAPDGLWDGGVYRPGWADEDRPMFDAWTATHFSLQQLRDLGVDPAAPAVVTALDRVERQVRWDHDDEPYFDGETEPCINGVALSIAAYFDRPGGPIAATLLRTQLPDGGWNCWDEDLSSPASLHSTICAIEGLADWHHTVPDAEIARALRRGQEVILERGLLFRRSTGELIDPRFAMLSYPVRWFYDVLRALEHFRAVDLPDPRLADAIALLRSKQRPDGRFAYENRHEGPVLFEMEGESEGAPSRWVTLRALRVLSWWDSRAGAGATADASA
jgi:hypothetical protein